MATKITFTVEAFMPKTVQAILDALVDLREEHLKYTGEAAISLTREGKRSGGSRKITDTAKANPGESLDIAPFGDAEGLTPLERAILDLAPKPGSGIESVTLSTGGQSATITAETGQRLRERRS